MSNLATIVNNILADSGIDDINVVVTTGSYANPAWITSLAWSKITGSPLGDYLPLAGGTMTGNINWAQTDRGLTWVFNTDGAYIKFYNTSDGDTDSRLEFATIDNNNEYFRWGHVPSGGSFYESMRLVPNSSGNAELIVSGKIIKSGGTTSQFLKANGDVDSTSYQPLLTNPVTGTGTTNFLPKFTGASTIGNSIVYDDGTNIGIGTISPQRKLDVNGDIRVRGGAIDLSNDFNNQVYSLSNAMYLKVNGTERFAITSAGNTQFILPNSGNSVGTGNITLISTATAVNDRLTINFSQTGIASRARAGIGSVAEESGGYAASLAFYTRNAIDGSALGTANERVRITSGGDVGINTPLGAGVNVRSLLNIKAAVADGNQIYLVQENDDRGWRMKAKNDGHFYLQSSYTGGTPIDAIKIFYDTNNVCINTTTDSGFRLDVNGTARVTSLITGGGGIKISGGTPSVGGYTKDGLWGATATPNFISTTGYGGSSGGNAFLLGYDDNESGLYSPAYGFPVKSTDGNNTPNRVVRALVMRDTDKNTYPFIVYNNGAIDTTGSVNIINSAAVLSLSIENTTNNAILRLKSTINPFWDFQANTNGTFQIDRNDSPVLTLGTSGNATFSSSVTAQLGLCVSGQGGLTNSASKFNLDFFGGNSRLYSLGANSSTKGGFEFHTNSSDGSLDVIALGISSTGVATFSNLAGTGTRMVVADASGVLSTQAIGSGSITGSGTTNYVSKFTSGSAIGNSQIFDNGTNVGIGTATPATKLEVRTNSPGVAAARFSDSNYADLVIGFPTVGVASIDFEYGAAGALAFRSGTGKTQRMFLTSAGELSVTLSTGAAAFGNGINIITQPGTFSTGHGGILQFQNEDVITAGIRGVRDPGSWASSLLFYTHTSAVGNTFGTTFTEKARITDDGNLLVNTVTNAGFRLDVGGTGRFTGALTGTTAIFTGGGRTLQVVSTTDAVPAVIRSSLGAISTLSFQGTTSTNDFNTRIGCDANDLVAFTNNEIRFRIASTGAATFNATAGTRNILIVAGGGDGSGQGKGNIRSSDAGGGNYWEFGRDNLSTGDFVITEYGGSPILRLRSSTGAATFSSSVTADGNIITSGVNNNIYSYTTDTTNGQPGLVVANNSTLGTSTNISYFKTYNYAATSLFGQTVTNWLFIGTEGAANNGILFGTVNSRPVIIGTANNERMRITSGGDVGINTTFSGINTASLLTIKAAVADGNQIYIVQSNDDRGWRMKAKTDGHFYLQSAYSSGNSDVLKACFDTGNVLIGTTTDSGFKFEVSGTAKVSSLLTGTGGVRINGGNGNTSYTPDGLWGGPATPNFIATTGYGGPHGNSLNNTGLLLGYQDNGSGLYSPAYGFQVKSTDGNNTPNRVVRAIVMKDVDKNNFPFIVFNNGAIESLSTVTATAFFESSDSRIKTLLDDKLDYQAIANVTAKYYEKNGKIELGYFAQDFETLLPSAISKNEDGYLNLSYREVHTAKIAYLEKRITELEKQLKNK